MDAIDLRYSWSVGGPPLATGASVAHTHIANVDVVAPVFDYARAAAAVAGTTIAAPSVQAAPAGSLVLAVFSATDGFVETAGVDVSDMTTIYAMSGGAVRLLGVHEILPDAADTGARTSTASTDGIPRIGQTIVLRPN